MRCLIAKSGKWFSGLVLALGLNSLNPSLARAAKLPNIVMVMADDLGWSDIGAYRSLQGLEPRIPTPNIDRLARHGMLFTDAHSPASLCAPTRFSMLTGSYPYRNGRQWGTWSLKMSAATSANRRHTTIAEVLRESGYRSAFFGKMHLGGDPLDSSGNVTRVEADIDFSRKVAGFPTSYGFDYSFGLSCGIQSPPYAYFENDIFAPIDPDNPVDNSSVKYWSTGRYNYSNGTSIISSASSEGLGDVDWDSSQTGLKLANKAVDFIDDHLNQHGEQPFMLYYCSQAIHVPHTPPIDFEPDADGHPGTPINQAVRGASGGGSTADMIYELDLQVGRIISKLEDPNQDGDTSDSILADTLFFFTSDNGGLPSSSDWGFPDYDSNGVLRGWKSHIWEGGHRVPFIAAWGDGTSSGSKIPPGSVSDQLICAHDWVATIYALTNQPVPDNQCMDAVNLIPVLLERQPATLPIREFMLHQSQKIPEGSSGSYDEMGETYAIRKGEYVLFLNSNRMPTHLYNLSKDISQTLNLIAEASQQVRIDEMKNMYLQHGTENSPRSTSPHIPDAVMTASGGVLPMLAEDFSQMPGSQPDNVTRAWPRTWFVREFAGEEMTDPDEHGPLSVKAEAGLVMTKGLQLGWAGDRVAVQWYSNLAIDMGEDYILRGKWEILQSYNPDEYTSGERGFRARIAEFTPDGQLVRLLADQHIDPENPQAGDSGPFSLRIDSAELLAAGVETANRLGIELYRNAENWPNQGGANDRYLIGDIVFGYADDDEDGMPNGYERHSGLNPNDPADASLDADGDGASNLTEYLAGTDARDPDDRFQLQAEIAELGEIFGITCPTVMPSRKYSLEVAHELGNPSAWTLVDSFSTGAFDNQNPLAFRHAIQGPKGLYRIRIDLSE
jgi:arylsulfatase A-like enzyme